MQYSWMRDDHYEEDLHHREPSAGTTVLQQWGPNAAKQYGASNRITYRALVSRWMERIYAGVADMPCYCEPGLATQSPIADWLDLPELADPKSTNASILTRFRKRVGEQPERAPQVADCPMRRAINWLSGSAGLNEVERSVFEVACCITAFRPFRLACNVWRDLNYGALITALSALLDRSVVEIERALDSDSRLLRSALIHLRESSAVEFSQALMVPRRLSWRIANVQGHPSRVLEEIVKPMKPPRNSHGVECNATGGVANHAPEPDIGEFEHLQAQTEVAHAWLHGVLADQIAGAVQSSVEKVSVRQDAKAEDEGHENALTRKTRSGGNLLVSGAPGLGKTAWVRALIRMVQQQMPGVQGYELAVLDRQGLPISGYERLSNLRMAMTVLCGVGRSDECAAESASAEEQRSVFMPSVLIFDEADDVFRSNESGLQADSESVSMTNHRASLNRLIEDSEVATVWIMNNVEILDPAVRRRFDAEIRFTLITRSVRLRLLGKAMTAQRNLGYAPSQATLQRWASLSDITPAMIERLEAIRRHAYQTRQQTRLVGEARKGDETSNALDALDRLCEQWLRERLGVESRRHLTRTTVSNPLLNWKWDDRLLNTSHDLMALVEGIARCAGARILLYGAPGTGKTAFAAALARMLDKPLLEKRASDLLSPYVGETEQRISSAFSEALEDAAVLFIDEADSLAYSRGSATRSWEVSLVNELLEQLQSFPGVAVLATNRLEVLDSAMLRRMDVKVEFFALSSRQIELAVQQLCAAAMKSDEGSLVLPHMRQFNEVTALKNVTCGDMAVMARRLALQGWPKPDQDLNALLTQMLTILKEELSHKRGKHSRIGFVVN